MASNNHLAFLKILRISMPAIRPGKCRTYNNTENALPSGPLPGKG